MLDLEKIAKSLRETLAKETTESIDKWFRECENESIQEYRGQGVYCKQQIQIDRYTLDLIQPLCTNSTDRNNDCTGMPYLQAA